MPNKKPFPTRHSKIVEKKDKSISSKSVEKTSWNFVIIGGIMQLTSGPIILLTQIPNMGKWAYSLVIFVSFVITYIISKNRNQRLLVTGVLGTFLIFFVLWRVMAYNEKKVEQTKVFNDKRITRIFEESDTTYKILILPFETYENENKVDIGKILYHRLKKFKTKEELEFNVKYWEINLNKDFNDSAEIWKNFHHANLIIYGTFIPEQSKFDGIISLNFIADDEEFLKNNKNSTETGLPIKLSGLSRGALQGNIDFIIQYVCGLKEFKKKNYTKAIERLMKIANSNNADKVDFFIGTAYSLIDSNAYAVKFLKSATENNPAFFEAHSNLGNQYLRNNNFENAVIEFETSINLCPTEPNSYLGLGLSKRFLNDYDGAISIYSRAIEINPSYQKAFKNRGVAEFYIKDFDGAMEDASKAIEIDPNDVEAYCNRGNVEIQIGEFKGAIEDFSEAIKLNSMFYEAFFCRGNAKSKRFGIQATISDCQGAIEDYSAAILINPKDKRAYFNRGLMHLKLVEMKNAINDFSQVITLDPTMAKAYFYRAKAKLGINDSKGAKLDFAVAKKLNPNLTPDYLLDGGQKYYIVN